MRIGRLPQPAPATDEPEIPFVVRGVADPARLGLIIRRARTGGNITGVSLLGQELAPKV